MSKKASLNPFELVLEISEIAKANEWKDKQDVKEDQESIKKIINRPTEIKNYPYEAYQSFMSNKDDDLS